MKKLFVNVDVDALRFYYNLYGEKKTIKDNIIWEKAIPRFLKLFKKINIKANFFIVGSDLLNNKNVTIAKKIIKEGHKINSHSYYHNYDLTKKDYKNIYIDIKKNQQIFYKLFKIKNLVFRSPGYKINYKVYKSMKNNKLRFSSSILPSFFYSLIKNFIIIKKFIFLKKSVSLIDYSLNLFKKKEPYVDRKTKIVEIPISVVPIFNIPLTGTFLSLMGKVFFVLSKNLLIKKNYINLEFHAIDMLDYKDLNKHMFLIENQLDLRKERHYKQKIYTMWINYISRTHSNVFLEDVFSK